MCLIGMFRLNQMIIPLIFTLHFLKANMLIFYFSLATSAYSHTKNVDQSTTKPEKKIIQVNQLKCTIWSTLERISQTNTYDLYQQICTKQFLCVFFHSPFASAIHRAHRVSESVRMWARHKNCIYSKKDSD